MLIDVRCYCRDVGRQSLTLPTEENKIYLNMAEKLLKCYVTDHNKKAIEFASWLVVFLDGVIIEAQKGTQVK